MTVSRPPIDEVKDRRRGRRPAASSRDAKRHRTGRLGFSLVELLTVMSLFGVALAIVVPPAATLVQRRASQVAADRFIAAHGLARSAAVRFGRVAELHIDATAGRYWIEVDTSQAGGARDTLGGLRHVVPEGLVTATSDRAVLCFDSRGLPTTRDACEAADATIIFSQSARADTVKIAITGKVLR